MFSLVRLFQQRASELPEQVQLAGQLVIRAEGQFLTGQGLAVKVLQELPKELAGDYVGITLARESLDLEQKQISEFIEVQHLGRHNPEFLFVPQFSVETQTKWGEFLAETRRFFSGRGAKEVTTPSLVDCPGMEANLVGFETKATFGKNQRNTFLPTSPELHLKKFLALGFTDIFEIKTCFRNEENSPLHSNEFQMLEWYRAFLNLEDLEKEATDFVIELCKSAGVNPPTKVNRLSFSEAFKQFADFELTPETSQTQMFELTQKLNLDGKATDSFEELVNLCLIEVIEPQFKTEELTVFHSYPPSMSALANINSEGWASRFELYWKGMELANAFDELRDPKEQIERFKKENQIRESRGEKPVPEDKEFYEALKRGLPPTVGIALGLDRLFMAMHSITDIQQLQPFLKRP